VARFHYPCALRWSDMDAYGHVNNVRFLTYLEEARVEMVTALTDDGATPPDLATGILVVHHEIDYTAPLVHRRDPVDVAVWVTDVGAATFSLAYEVADPGVVYARAASKLATYDLREDRLRRMTASEREWLGRYRDDVVVS